MDSAWLWAQTCIFYNLTIDNLIWNKLSWLRHFNVPWLNLTFALASTTLHIKFKQKRFCRLLILKYIFFNTFLNFLHKYVINDKPDLITPLYYKFIFIFGSLVNKINYLNVRRHPYANSNFSRQTIFRAKIEVSILHLRLSDLPLYMKKEQIASATL